MQLTISTALNKVVNFVGTTIQKVTCLTKPQVKFLLWLFERWWMLPVRYNFLNLSRYGGYSEKAIRDQFSKKLPFISLFDAVYSPLKKKECILAFDPTFLAKAGKKTVGLGWFWNGSHQRTEKGLEAGVLALIDVIDRTAYHFEAVQTQIATDVVDKDSDKRMEQYVKMITERKAQIQPYTTVIVADGYFMKKSFIEALAKEGFQIVTKGRRDANMKYLFNGQQKGGKGRPKQFSGKVDLQNIDKRVWKTCYQDEEEKITAYEAVVYSVSLKCKVKAVYVQREDKGYELLISTDVEMKGEKVLEYYRLRFQIEFLIRDAKTYTGLEHCQARSKEKLYNHWNMALFSVSIAKWQVWAKLTKEEKKETPFSMRTIKTYCLNKYIAETIFVNLGLDLSANKIKKLFNQCLNIGNMAA